MATNSAIEWTEATWNPLAGCSIVSTECRECYAMKLAHRLAAIGQEKYKGLTEVHNGKVVWNGTVRLDRKSLDIPHQRKKPTLYFVNSMSDMFHESLSHGDICEIWSTMVVCDRHRYQVLTKRPKQMRDFVNSWIDHMRAGSKSPVKNIWLGTSVGVRSAKWRIDVLRETNAAIRFLSLEPLLEDLGELDLSGIHWVIVGGESGPNARPMNPKWARSIRDQCKTANVPFFFKQNGEFVQFAMCSTADEGEDIGQKKGRFIAGDFDEKHKSRWVYKRVGKKAAGRLLDGKLHSEYPA